MRTVPDVDRPVPQRGRPDVPARRRVVERRPCRPVRLAGHPVDVNNDGDLDLVSRPGREPTRRCASTATTAPAPSAPRPPRSRSCLHDGADLAVHAIVAGDLIGDCDRPGDREVVGLPLEHRRPLPGRRVRHAGNGDGTFDDPTEHVRGGGAGVGEGWWTSTSTASSIPRRPTRPGRRGVPRQGRRHVRTRPSVLGGHPCGPSPPGRPTSTGTGAPRWISSCVRTTSGWWCSTTPPGGVPVGPAPRPVGHPDRRRS